MKILELFAGTRSIGKSFEARGHQVFSVDLDKRFENIDWYVDISTITAKDILERFGRPDVIWNSPDCFIKGNLVWTSNGYKNIEDIECKDLLRIPPLGFSINHTIGESSFIKLCKLTFKLSQNFAYSDTGHKFPFLFCEHIVDICEELYKRSNNNEDTNS